MSKDKVWKMNEKRSLLLQVVHASFVWRTMARDSLNCRIDGNSCINRYITISAGLGYVLPCSTARRSLHLEDSPRPMNSVRDSILQGWKEYLRTLAIKNSVKQSPRKICRVIKRQEGESTIKQTVRPTLPLSVVYISYSLTLIHATRVDSIRLTSARTALKEGSSLWINE